MGENLNSGSQNGDISVKTAPPKKRIRIGFIFLSLVPVAVLTLVQTLAQMPFLILSAVNVVNSGERFSEPADMVDTIMGTFNDKYSVFMYMVYAVVGLIIFSIWYFKGLVKKYPKVKPGEVFGVRSVLAAVLIDRKSVV